MIYLDNAATTQMDAKVIDYMHELMHNHYGNPSSIHAYGRQAKVLVENARTKISSLLKVFPAEIFFTSGGTEGINTIINGVLCKPEITKVITSPIEHSAMLNSINHYSKLYNVELCMLAVDDKGNVNLKELATELENHDGKSLVSLMHANNEIGTLLSIKKVGEICKKNNALFLSDTVQTIGKFRNDFSAGYPDFAIGSAHKFHGPKGVGFVFINGNNKVDPLFIGTQERNMRAGTENIFAIAAMAKAMEIAYENMDSVIKKYAELKSYLLDTIKSEIGNISYNGDIDGLPNLINIAIPKTANNEMLLMKFDIAGVMISGGSACSSGALKDSHVIKALGKANEYRAIRIAFSKYTTTEEIDKFIEVLKKV
ncbi:MAG: cysteine desulfurase [Bacteroidetes bacterium]|nr:MAG: cysteine desulfurase [Bacteroidota bacterium]